MKLSIARAKVQQQESRNLFYTATLSAEEKSLLEYIRQTSDEHTKQLKTLQDTVEAMKDREPIQTHTDEPVQGNPFKDNPSKDNPSQPDSIQQQFREQAKQLATLQASIDTLTGLVTARPERSTRSSPTTSTAFDAESPVTHFSQNVGKKLDSVLSHLEEQRRPRELKHVLLPSTHLVHMEQKFFVYMPPRAEGMVVPLEVLVPPDETADIPISAYSPTPLAIQHARQLTLFPLPDQQPPTFNAPPHAPVRLSVQPPSKPANIHAVPPVPIHPAMAQRRKLPQAVVPQLRPAHPIPPHPIPPHPITREKSPSILVNS